jgi:hypothetical protein
MNPQGFLSRNRGDHLLIFLLIVLTSTMVSTTAESRQIRTPSSPGVQDKMVEPAKAAEDNPSAPQITWIGVGDLARVTVNNVGMIGLYEAPESWDGTYDGTLPYGTTNWHGWTAEYPRSSGQYYLFSSGLWIGALYPVISRSDTTWEPRVATGAYVPDVMPMSPLYLSTQIIPPGEAGAGDFLFVPPGSAPAAYQRPWEYADSSSLNARRRATYGTDEYDLDPAAGEIVSEQDSWCVWGDWIPEDEGQFLWPSFGYDTEGLGIRVEQKSYCWDIEPHSNYIFLGYQIKNMNDFALRDLYVGYFMDADVGPGEVEVAEAGPNDDLIGFDIPRKMGYSYDSDGQEPGWLFPAGYIGAAFLRTPAGAGLTALSTWSIYWAEGIVTDDGQDRSKYGQLVGDSDGNGHATPDDPDTAVFETVTSPRDVRSLMASGPLVQLAPGEEVEVTVAMIAGYTLEELEEYTDSAQALYDRGYLVWEASISEIEVSPRRLAPGEDIQVNARVRDRDGVSKVMAAFSDPSLVDTLLLYDDGEHGDGTWGDHLYGNSWTTDPSAMTYLMNLSVWDSLSNLRVYENADSFTTLGPLQTAGYHLCGPDTTASPGDSVNLTILLENAGQGTVQEVMASVLAATGEEKNLSFGDIASGETVESREDIRLFVPEDWSAEETIRLDVSITDSAVVNTQWLDSLMVVVTDDVAPVIHHPECDSTFVQAGQAVTIRTELVDGAGVQAAWADIESPVGHIIVHHLPLYDDGLHDDALAGDGIFGNRWTTQAGEERFYNVNLSVRDSLGNQKDYVNLMEFTTKPFKTTAKILLVDDDHYNRPHHGTSRSYETYYMDALEANGYSYDLWNIFCYGSFDASKLSLYEIIIWETGETCGRLSYREEYNNSETLNPSERHRLELFLYFHEGKLFLSGQGLADLESQWILRHIGISSFNYDVGKDQLIGVSDNPIGAGLSAELSGGSGADNQFVQSAMVPAAEQYQTYPDSGYPVFQYADHTGEGVAALMAYTDDYASVTFSFGFEAIADEETRNMIMDRVIKWLRNPTAVEGGTGSEGPLPTSYSLSQNYPNPFNPSTELRYALPRDVRVTLEIYNILGQRVATPVDEHQRAGYKTIRWDPQGLASGIYLCRLQAGDYTQTRKMVLLK